MVYKNLQRETAQNGTWSKIRTLLGWLRWLERHPVTEGLRVQFPVRAHTYVAGLVPSPDMYDPWSGPIWKATNRCFSLSLSLSKNQ